MADEIVTRQQLVDAGLDAESLQKFISGTEFEDVLTRLGMQYPTLAKAVLLIHQLGESKIDDVLNDLKIRYLALSVRGNWTANTAYEIKDLVFVNNITYICLIDHTSSSNFQNDVNAGKWIVYQGVTQVDLQSYVAMNKTYAPVLGSPVKFKLNPIMASFMYGLNDPRPLDDLERDFFRGISNKDAWAPENIGIGASSRGRNGCAKAYLSSTDGHDCITYGVASRAFGAACCTGNPDEPEDGTNWGYGSLAGGRNSWARGKKALAFGEWCDALSRYCVAMGYKAIAGPSDPADPNYLPDGAEGAAAYAHGYEVKAHGNFALALGAFVEAFNGAMVIGRGLFTEQGIKPLKISKRGVGIGYNVDIPTIFCQAGVGNNGDHAAIGFNTDSPRNKYHFALKSADTLNYVIDAVGSNETVFSQETVGKLSNGNYASLHNIVTYHTNANVASAIVEYRLNSTPYLKVDQSLNADFSAAVNVKTGFYYNGVKVVGQRQAAIAKLPNNASLADVIAKMNEIIEGVTNHGLFAPST
ncbi:TPA: carbohydrate-binding protein [Acinetobacter baumannii]